MRFFFTGMIAALALAAGCASLGHSRTAIVLSSSQAAEISSRAALSPDEISGATKLYNLKCARCHKFYDPAGYTEREWQSWMAKMSRKSRLKPEQEQLLSRYLGAFRVR